MTGRVVVELVLDGSYRLTEQDGELVYSWLPGVEDDGAWPVDMGGFLSKESAFSFKLGIDLIRAEHGMICESPDQIEQERQALDVIPPGRHATRTDEQAILARFAARVRAWGSPEMDVADTLEGFAARALQRMQEPEPRSEPVVEYRRVRVA
jgi:hypothetical protein